MTWQKVYYIPIPLICMRAIMRKRWYGWEIIYRDLNGKCYRDRELLTPDTCPRE